MTTFTVRSASQKKAFDGKYGPSQVISLTLENGSGETKQAEWLTKATTPLPAEGSTLEGELTSGDYGLNFKRASGGGGGFGGGGAKDDYWRRKEERDVEGVARMGRAHAQEMALRWVQVCGLEVDGLVDLSPFIDWFEADVNAKSAGTGGGSSSTVSLQSSNPPSVAGSSARGFQSLKQKEHFERLLRKAGATPETAANIVGYAESEWTADGAIREAFDGLTQADTARPTAMAIAQRAKEWAANQPAAGEPDTRDLPEPDGSVVMPDNHDIPFARPEYPGFFDERERRANRASDRPPAFM